MTSTTIQTVELTLRERDTYYAKAISPAHDLNAPKRRPEIREVLKIFDRRMVTFCGKIGMLAIAMHVLRRRHTH
ncbi:protein of unknown function [Hyphomicrobium sp. MC1]|nr:protein of unknown function [Hyphomicrobium sp. MC1]